MSKFIALPALVFAMSGVLSQAVFAKGATAPSVVDDIIDVYADGCDVGSSARYALERSRALTSIYKKLLQNAQCKDAISTSLATSEALTGTLDNMLMSESARNEQIYSRTSNDLLTQIQDPNLLPDARSTMTSQYALSRFNLAQARAQTRAYNRVTPGQVGGGLETVASHLRTLVSERDNIWSCLANNPVEAYKLGTTLMDLAGNFTPPMIGASLKAAALLTNVTVDVAQKAPIVNAIRDSQRDRMPFALRCGLETITRDYCRGRDAYRLTGYWRRDDEGLKPSPLFAGLDVLDYRLPALNAWLDRIVTGTRPRDADSANKVNVYFLRVAQAQAIERRLEGVFAEAEADFSRIADPLSRLDRLRRVLKEIVSKAIFFCGADTALGNYCTSNESPFYADSPLPLIEVVLGATKLDSNETFAALIDRVVTTPDMVGNFQTYKQMVYGIFYNKREEAKRLLGEKVNVDSPSLVRDATRRNVGRVSPLQAIDRLFSFFNAYVFEDDFPGDQDRDLVGEIRTKLEQLSTDLRRGDAGRDEVSTQIIAKVFDAFKLSNNNVFLSERVTGLINTDLTNRFYRGDLPKDLEDIAWIARQDIVNALSVSGLDTPYGVQSDITDGLSTQGRTLVTFRKGFNNVIAEAIKRLKASADRDREPTFDQLERMWSNPTDFPPLAPNRDALARTCILTLISGMDWPAGPMAKKACAGAVIYSREAKTRLRFEDLQAQIANRPFQDRVCLYEDFLKNDRLATVRFTLPDPADRGEGR